MRISADKDDAGYIPPECRHGVRIILDGEELHSIITADEEQGYILRVRCDEHHRLIAGDGVVVTEELRGTVEIIHP